MAKDKKEFVDKVYKLLRDAAPLSFMLPARNTKRFPLHYFDESTGKTRALRYASNQKSPFEDEQDENPILTPIIFIDGMLTVSRQNQVLQEFLHYHPMNGKKFVEVNKEADAQAAVDKMLKQDDAVAAARKLEAEEMETVGRGLLGLDVKNLKTSEIKRDILLFARNNPDAFLNAIDDPTMKLKAKVKGFFDSRVLAFRNQQKEVFFNMEGNKKRMLTIPFGVDPYEACIKFFSSDDGVEVLEMLEKSSE